MEKYLREGGTYYLKHDFNGAIGAYCKALELGKQAPTPDPILLRVLVDNLGMAYGISGERISNQRKDESFQRFMKDDRFLVALK